jgi:hypothetical protein
LVVVGFLALLPLGCAPGTRPFQVVQLCVHDRDGATQLIGDLRELAKSMHMEFFDSGAITEKDLASIGYRGREREDGSEMISIGLLRRDGLGIGGGNLGLPGYQVALGFSKGADEAESRRFAGEVINRLERQWHVEVLPPGSPATPMNDCR